MTIVPPGDSDNAWDDPMAPTERIHSSGANYDGTGRTEGPSGTSPVGGSGASDDDDRLTLGVTFYDVGGDPEVTRPPHTFAAARLGWPSRLLLRVIGVDTDCVPAGEQWKLCLMAMTVPVNATIAAVFAPIGLTVAYGHLTPLGAMVAALVAGFVIGVIDALVVGQWHNYGKWLTRIDPDAPIPEMPDTGHRVLVLAPRLLVTAGIVFTLGLMLTFAVNQTAVRQEMGTLNADHNKSTRLSLIQPYEKDIATAQQSIKNALITYNTDLQNETKYTQLASCELNGYPVVSGCSGVDGSGTLYDNYNRLAKAANADAQQQMTTVNSSRTAITNWKQDEQNVESSSPYQQAMIPATGFLAAESAYNAYVSAHHIPWWDAWRWDLLLLVLDLTPLLIKLSNGVTQYEAELWWRHHQRAIEAHHGDELWKRSLKANDELHEGITTAWVEAGIRRASTRLAEQVTPRPRSRTWRSTAQWQPPMTPQHGSRSEPHAETQDGPAEAPDRPETTRVRRADNTHAEPPGSTRRERSTPSQDEDVEAEMSSGAPLAAPVGIPVVVTVSGSAFPGATSGADIRGEDPFNLGRNARFGDVMHLSGGDYLLLNRLTDPKAGNSDVFIAVELPKTGQRTPNSLDGSPVRAVKLTKLDEGTGRVMPMSDAERLLLDYFPAHEALLEVSSLTFNHDGRIAHTMPYLPCGDLERYVFGRGRPRPQLTSTHAIEAGLTVARGLRQFWDLGLSHNDVRLRNVLVAGPLQGDDDPLARLAPGLPGQVMLTDYNFVGYLTDSYQDPPGLVVNALDGDPQVVRWMLENGDRSGMPSPLGMATDSYAAYAIIYMLLTGGLSPTTALLLKNGWPVEAIQLFDTPTSSETWRELLSNDPGLLLRDPPSLTEFGVDPAVALVVDTGVRADPALRQPQISGVGQVDPETVQASVEDSLTFARDRADRGWLQQPLRPLDDKHPWFGRIKAPIGYPREVLDCLAHHWPDFVRGVAA